MSIKRNETLDTAKGVLIILMVIGHSGCPGYIADLIYLFHMPCFFLISGVCLSDKYADNRLLFIRRKITTLYFPFIKWSFLFLIFHNLFYSLNLYDKPYDIIEFLKRSLGILTMTVSEQLLGGFWFLKELFYASIIGGFSLFYLKKHHSGGGIFLPLLFLLSACVISVLPFKIPSISSVTMLACCYYSLGYWNKKFMANLAYNNLIFWGAFLTLCFIPMYYTGSMFYNIGYEVVVYFLISLIGCLALLLFSSLLVKLNIHKNIRIVGQATLYILTFHFLSFKIVTFCLNCCFGMSLPLVDFPVPISKPLLLFVVYVIFGVLIPLEIWKAKNYLVSYMREKSLMNRNDHE